MKKYSRQRELILTSLKQRKDHPTVEMLFADLKKEMPEIGIATIYRNLTDLLQEGEIIKIKSQLGKDRFDGNIQPHIHFECEKCLEIEDIFLQEKEAKQFDDEIKKISNMIDAKPTISFILIHGYCKNCKNQKENEE